MYFSHPMVKDGLTLSSPDEAVRRFWIDHCKASRRIAQQIGKTLNDKVLNNVWIPDGYKDTPSDRLSPRKRLKEALDEVFAENCPNVYNLMDAGHYHPSESISDKISAMLLYFQYVPLHVTRGVNWDSDHVVSFDDETKEICKEIVRNDALDRVLVGLDFFDVSINRVAAWVIGCRNFEKALLWALLQPDDELKAMQDKGDFTGRPMLQEEVKTLPFADIWAEYCRRAGVPEGREWFETVKQYEIDVLRKRG